MNVKPLSQDGFAVHNSMLNVTQTHNNNNWTASERGGAPASDATARRRLLSQRLSEPPQTPAGFFTRLRQGRSANIPGTLAHQQGLKDEQKAKEDAAAEDDLKSPSSVASKSLANA